MTASTEMEIIIEGNWHFHTTLRCSSQLSRFGDITSQGKRRCCSPGSNVGSSIALSARGSKPHSPFDRDRTHTTLIGVSPVFLVKTLIKSSGYPVHCRVQNPQTVA